LALRINWGGKIIAYTGDSQWTKALVPLAQNADLLIAEAYFYGSSGECLGEPVLMSAIAT
jgi:ribonuclease BN (tRNA processing enzyme)